MGRVRAPIPLAAATPGFGFDDATADQIKLSFEATPAFTNPRARCWAPSKRPCCTTHGLADVSSADGARRVRADGDGAGHGRIR
jgi:hypothetical protein